MDQERKFGKYRLKQKIGEGGMGEVYLAEDPVCKRLIALKKITPKLLKYSSIRNRFMREASIAAQLSHPSIMPIYSIHQEKSELYYTMPYVEGKTLKEVIDTAKKTKVEPSLSTILQIYLKICQAIYYTHSRGFLHRDIKPDNVIIGKFGEVLILDWGIAIPLNDLETNSEEIISNTSPNITESGKVVGTVSYMAPERALDGASTVATDIYSLGVILYQILTLRLPFIRTSIKVFKQRAKHETLLDPEEMAPFRDIPKQLATIAKKCLEKNPKDRYTSVDHMIHDLENYLEGAPIWNKSSSLQIENKGDWEFQENILLAKHIALTRVTEVMEWVMLMVSKEPYSGPIKLETSISLEPEADGVGFLLGCPETAERKKLEDGYCLWIGINGCKLFRDNVEVIHLPDVCLIPNTTYIISIEKLDHDFYCYLNGKKILSYTCHMPIIGAHVGFLYKDTNFTIDAINVYLGSQNVMVKCLAIPDAFFSYKEFEHALLEYRRIGSSFPGRREGRTALFRAGITLIEQGRRNQCKKTLAMALDEFEKLHQTPGEPLEYRGKSLVYRAENDTAEEVKCLELALRKYRNHPLFSILENHVDFRLHETSKQDRQGAYYFALLTIRQLPEHLKKESTKQLIESLTKNWEPLSFILPIKNQNAMPIQSSIILAFWLAKPQTLFEIYQSISDDLEERKQIIENIFFSFLFMGEVIYAKNLLDLESLPSEFSLAFESQYAEVKDPRLLTYLFEKNLNEESAAAILPALIKQPSNQMHAIWVHLLLHQMENAHKLLKKASPKEPLYNFLYGIYLLGTEGVKSCHNYFKQAAKISNPPTHRLLEQFLCGHITLKKSSSRFSFENKKLFQQLALYNKISEDLDKSLFSRSKLKKHLLLLK